MIVLLSAAPRRKVHVYGLVAGMSFRKVAPNVLLQLLTLSRILRYPLCQLLEQARDCSIVVTARLARRFARQQPMRIAGGDAARSARGHWSVCVSRQPQQMARCLQQNRVPGRFPGQQRSQEPLRQPWLTELRFSIRESQLQVEDLEDGSLHLPVRMHCERRGGFCGQLLRVVL